MDTLNLLLRGAAVGVLLLAAAVLWRDQRRGIAGRLGTAFAIGVAAATLAAMPGFRPTPDAAHAIVAALAAGNMFVFWLFTRALLADDFHLRPWQLVVWAALCALGAWQCFGLAPRAELGWLLGALPVFWALLVIVESLGTWRADLIEGRRRLRTLIVAATAIYTVGQWLVALATGATLRAVVESPLNAAGTAALALVLTWRLLRIDASELFAPESASHAITPPPSELPKPDPRQVATLERLMAVERVYREPSLTIAALAQRVGLPEHRLRKLINQALGHRNFNTFLNAYRIEDAKRALRDARQAEVPVLTIAMDAGFQSLGPFNRAFKAATGQTPSEFRREALAVPAVETETA